MSQTPLNTPNAILTHPNFSEIEERTFILLDNAEKSHAQLGTLVDKLTALLERLEQAEKQREQKFAEAEKRVSANEQARQQTWEQWKTEQSQRWQNQHQQDLTEWQAEQKQQWQTWQSQVETTWQYWRNEQHNKMVTEIKTVTQSANAIIAKLDDKVKTVNLTVQSVNTLIQNGTAQAITTLIGEQVSQSVGKTLTGISNELNHTTTAIQNSQASAQRLQATFVELEHNTFDSLQTKVEAQVKTGVENGLTAGLADSTQKISQSLASVAATSLEIQQNLVSEFDKGVKQAVTEVTTAKQAVYDDIHLNHILVKDNTEECIKSLQTVKQVADKSVVGVKKYHANLVNKGHGRWVAGWTVLLTALVTGAGLITYHVNKPDYAERDAVATDITMLLQQKSAIEHSYSMLKTKTQDGKFYTLVDKSDCIDGDYCKQREPTAFTTPTPQQLTPPKPITPNNPQPIQNSQPVTPTTNSQSSYQSTGDSKNMYGSNGNNSGTSNNPFGTGKRNPNPYKNN